MAPMHNPPSEDDIASTLTHLKLSPKDPQKPLHKPKSKPVADSWDEEDLSGSDTETEENAGPAQPLSSTSTNTTTTTATTTSTTATAPSTDSPTSPISILSSINSPPNPPPPTPASPTPFDGFPDNSPYRSGAAFGSGPGGAVGRSASEKRPEKTTAVAGRLIAGALGVRAPRRTDEEREFDRVVREKERRRRVEEKERESREAEERERRKKAVWED
ncbi:hypothetical protein IAQ61_003888 [Plenodomus lingam]|uniref:Predicted protein n=1 Tax=Leptosphaeria maculans (strain JN3 / isolate v23.1.3 / race Av1-4-5-6-7-8) TaxID=985895 RepID=E4ZQK9_LEPMJ|nr:predicted protein [Plenodomus lingam JN3]KAH9874698.1 hypothetical protein IAQ61_003888 [Plenodomus lingam]CBX94014.1 predicted protein [Plenodomus lingam JN3]